MSIEELAQEILKHKNLYYSGKAEIDDFEFDRLEEKLRSLSPNHPVLSMVGSEVKSSQKVKHDKKMLSLAKTYNIDDLKDWMAKGASVSTHKIDGSSCSLVFNKGHLKLAKTRGDGVFGEDITQKVWFISSFPKEIQFKKDLEIRGEIFCTEENFIKLAHVMEERGLEKPTSQRNIVAGLLGRKENIDLCRYLTFYAFEVFGEKEFDTEVQKFKFLQSLHFETPDFVVHKTSEKIAPLLQEIESFMSEGDYLIDGLVLTYNDLSLHEELGYTAHHPRYKMAFKFQGESKTTEIVDIEWSVSRNGILTPVANVKPIELSGAMISRVTLHNYGLVKEFKLKSGDLIDVVRSGEVIPKFMGVKKASAEKFKTPRHCPSCQQKVIEEDIRLICVNPQCPDKMQDSILNFIKKIGIDDLSDKRLNELIKNNMIEDAASLYDLTVEDFLTLDKTKEKLANKMFQNIQKSKKTSLVKFLSALGIQGGAQSKNERIVMGGFDSIEKVLSLSVAKLQEIEGFAEKSSTDYLNSLKEKEGLIQRLLERGFEIAKPEKAKSQIFSGLKFCITGTLKRKRSEIQKDIKTNGGEAQSSVTSKTNYLVTNDTSSGSSKLKKAKDLNIPIISEDELYQKMEG